MSYSPWRDASKPINIFGIPALAYLVFLIWFHWPSQMMFYFCLALLGAYKWLDTKGYTATVLFQHLLHRLRGSQLTGRPWWYRNFFR